MRKQTENERMDRPFVVYALVIVAVTLLLGAWIIVGTQADADNVLPAAGVDESEKRADARRRESPPTPAPIATPAATTTPSNVEGGVVRVRVVSASSLEPLPNSVLYAAR